VDDSDRQSGRVVAVHPASGDVVDPPPQRLERGPLGVVIVVDGVPIGDLPAGARLRVGPSAVVELGSAAQAQDGSATPRCCGTGGFLESGAGDLVRAKVLDAGEVAAGDRVALEAVAVPVTDVLDLHSFRPGETQQVVAAYLGEARQAGLGEVRIIHGRGRGVQRALVHRVLNAAPGVAGFADAPPTRGGWGATVVRLRPAEDSQSR